MTVNWSEWAKENGEIPQCFVSEINPTTRLTYRNDPNLLEVDRNIVSLIAQGDYRNRQIFELIQNASDAILEDQSLVDGGRVKLLLTENGLYCGNQGAPFGLEGIHALRYPIKSTKTGNQIGRYGQGFKSVLAVTNKPVVYSKTGSFSFDFESVVDYLSTHLEDGFPDLDSKAFGTKEKPSVSIFAVPRPIDPELAASEDPILEEMMEWATTVIFLPFVEGYHFTDNPPFEHLKLEMETFPANFLVFAGHIAQLDFEVRDFDKFVAKRYFCETKSSTLIRPSVHDEARCFGENAIQMRVCSVRREGDPASQDWAIFTDENVQISDVGSFGVEHNRRIALDGSYLPVPVSWAVRLNPSSTGRGEFWFHFPTKEWTSLAGIVNAPWDTNNERTLVLENRFNEYLIQRVCHLVHQAMPSLVGFMSDDVGKVFDLVPARAAEAEGIAKLLAKRVPELAQSYATIPNLDGELTNPENLRRYPSKLLEMGNEKAAELAQMWADADGSPRDFPHWSCISSTNRAARLRIWLSVQNELSVKND